MIVDLIGVWDDGVAQTDAARANTSQPIQVTAGEKLVVNLRCVNRAGVPRALTGNKLVLLVKKNSADLRYVFRLVALLSATSPDTCSFTVEPGDWLPNQTSGRYVYEIWCTDGTGARQPVVDLSQFFVAPTVLNDVDLQGLRTGAPPAPASLGTGFLHVTSNVLDPTARAVNLATVDITGILSTANGGTGIGATPGALLQSDWYIDWVNGNDAHDGKTSGTAVKTVMGGVVGKWGTPNPILSQSTTLHILTPQPLGAEKIIIGPEMLGASTFAIVGTPALSATISLGVVTAKNRGTKTLLQAAGFTGYTAGQLVINNTKGGHALILSVNAGVATMMQPIQPYVRGTDTVYFPAVTEIDTWAQNDSVSVYDLPTLNLVDFEGHGPEINSALTTGGIIWIDSIKILDQSGTPGTTNFCPEYEGGYAILQDVWCEAYMITSAVTYLNMFANVWLQWGGQLEHTYLVGGADSGFGILLQHINWMDGDHIVDAPSAATGFLYTGFSCIDSNGSMILHPGTAAEIRVNFSPTGGIMWGAGRLSLQADSALIRRSPTTSWATCLILGTITLPSNAIVGAAFLPDTGGFLGNLALTPANLDTYHGLQDPRTGARFAEDL